VCIVFVLSLSLSLSLSDEQSTIVKRSNKIGALAEGSLAQRRGVDELEHTMQVCLTTRIGCHGNAHTLVAKQRRAFCFVGEGLAGDHGVWRDASLSNGRRYCQCWSGVGNMASYQGWRGVLCVMYECLSVSYIHNNNQQQQQQRRRRSWEQRC
jgi:hypothetical protein